METRRSVLKRGAAAAGGVALQAGRAAAQQRGSSAGRKFRALVRYRTGVSVEELKLLPIQPREVVIRTQASAVCYTIVGQVQIGRAHV